MTLHTIGSKSERITNNFGKQSGSYRLDY